ncbi:16S rRNA (adenine1518-N6/adenine1519-N6)-dimethyltransferase [Ruaniaceae bacterium KH17]|nr:16S rRNA (adenine1518-N6/adenine1519-N6)-dimethyltransferase [Ruaniaceae bacterium KH17]
MRLLTPPDIRRLSADAGVRPTKQLGQNFVHDAGTVRKIVREAEVVPGDVVLEVGPGLGSLTLGLLEAGAHVIAVEIDDVMAPLLPRTIAEFAPEAADHLAVLHADALTITGPDMLPAPASLQPDGAPASLDAASGLPSAEVEQDSTLEVSTVESCSDSGMAAGVAAEGSAEATVAAGVVRLAPTKLVANLPYNVATPVLLTLLEVLPSLESVLVMVQAEVADRIAEPPGSRTYGIPSAKAAWYASAGRAGTISRAVFWPVPNVDSALVRLTRREPPATTASREEVFAVVDAAFAQRRKTLRAALADWAGSAPAAEEALRVAGVDPQRRGETLGIDEFAKIAEAR